MEGALEAPCPEAPGPPLAGDKWQRGWSEATSGGRRARKRLFRGVRGRGGAGGGAGGAAIPAVPAPAQVGGTGRLPDGNQLRAQAGLEKDPAVVSGCPHLCTPVQLGRTDGGGGLGTQSSHWGGYAGGGGRGFPVLRLHSSP